MSISLNTLIAEAPVLALMDQHAPTATNVMVSNFLRSGRSNYTTNQPLYAPDFGGQRQRSFPNPERRVLVLDGRLIRNDGQALVLPEYRKNLLGSLFCMGGNGSIYVTDAPIHHHALMGLSPAAAAGELFYLSAEKFLVVHDKSGHYRPSLFNTAQFVVELALKGFDIISTRFELESHPSLDLFGLTEFLRFAEQSFLKERGSFRRPFVGNTSRF